MRTHAGTVMLQVVATVALIAPLSAGVPPAVAAPHPPFDGTIFIDPDIITPADPTALESVTYTGRGHRRMFDRRVDGWIRVNAYLFDVQFSDGLDTEIQVNPEFGSSDAASVPAKKFARVIGQLPRVLRVDVDAVWIHKGTELFGGGNNALLIYTGQAVLYEADGILEEALVHEATHTSLDASHAAAPGWLDAQTADGTFISTYAQDFPDREDVAESFLTYLVVRCKADRASGALVRTIKTTIPHRIAYFDKQAFDLSPLVPTTLTQSQQAGDGWVRESSPTSSAGGAVNKGASTLRVGDDESNRQYRSVLSFDTGAVPNDAVVQTVTLRLRRNGVAGAGDPLIRFGGFMVDVKTGSFGGPELRAGDFQSAAGKTVRTMRPALVHGWYALDLTKARSIVDKTGLTQIRLRFKRQDDGNDHANILTLYSGDSGTPTRPRLIVQYAAP